MNRVVRKPLSIAINWLTLMLLGLSICRTAAAQAPPAQSKLTPQQQERLKERDRLYAEVQRLDDAGKFDEAIAAAQKMAAIDREVLGNDHPDTLGALNYLASLHRSKGDFAGARKFCEEVLAAKTRLFGKDAWQVTDARLSLADVDIWAKLKPEDRQALAHCNELAKQVQALVAKGDAKSALTLAKEVVATRTRVLGENHRLTGFACSWLASIYDDLGQSAEAERFHLQSLDIQKAVLGEGHPQYAQGLANLAGFYQYKGNYAQAEPLYRQTLEIRRGALGENHPLFADTLNRLADLYCDMGQYAKGEALCRQALEIEKKVLGEKDPQYLRCLESLALICEDQGDYAKAEPLYLQALEITKTVLGEKNKNYATCLDNLSVLYSRMGAYAKAESFCRQALAIRKELLGEKHLDYAHSLENLALLYDDMGELAEAEPLLLQVLKIRKEALGEKHPVYAYSLNNLAVHYEGLGDYAKAEQYLSQAVEIRKEVLGEKHPLYAATLSNLASVYDYLGQQGKAESLCRQALAIRKEVLGENDPDYAANLAGLAWLCEEKGDYAQAESLCRQVLAIRKKVLGEKHPDYADSLKVLASLYTDLGDYARAEPLLRQSLQIRKEIFGEKNVHYAKSLFSLALLYQSMGDTAKAEPLYRQVLAIDRQVLGEMHPDYAADLNRLASLYKHAGNYAGAESLYQQALRIYKQAHGEKHPDYATTIYNLAGLYVDMGDYAKAEPLYRSTVEIYKGTVGDKHPKYARSLDSLGLLYIQMGNYAQAEPLCRQAAEILKQALGEKQESYANCLNNLAALYCLTGDYAKAEPLAQQAIQIYREHLELTAAVQSERQEEAMRVKVWEYLDNYLSITAQSKSSGEQVYPEVLSWKGEVGARQQQIRRLHHQLAASGNPEAARLEAELADTAHRLAALPRQTNLSAAERQSQETALSDKLEQLQAALAAASVDFRKQLDQQHLTPDGIRKALPEGAVLIDLLGYRSFAPSPVKGKPGTWQNKLTAFVVRSGAPIERVELGPREPIDSAITQWRRTFGAKTATDDPGTELRQLLWQPLERYVADAKTVLISPNSLTAPLPWAALPGKQPGTYLIDDVAIAIVPIPRLLPELLAGAADSRQADKNPSLLLVGDVDFGADPGSRQLATLEHVAARGGEQFNWPALPGTRNEVAAIQASFATQFSGGTATVLTQTRATKSAVRAAVGQCEYLHFSTHGFFAPPEMKSAGIASGTSRNASSDPLAAGQSSASELDSGLLSGLVLAGANQRYADGKEDGILTSLEVADLDLSHVRLATLSACETGLGQSAGAEGLLGLQRAFQTAGAKTVVASLWKVPDKATQLLMTRFYDNLWHKKMSKIEALREAQLWLLHEGPNQPGLLRGLEFSPGLEEPQSQTPGLSPRLWAAFVLSGDWR